MSLDNKNKYIVNVKPGELEYDKQNNKIILNILTFIYTIYIILYIINWIINK